MSKRYSIADARANLPTIVDEVEAGREIELTRRGQPVAVMISRQRYARLRSDRPRFGDRYLAFIERFRLEEIAADRDTFGPRREPGAGRSVDL